METYRKPTNHKQFCSFENCGEQLHKGDLIFKLEHYSGMYSGRRIYHFDCFIKEIALLIMKTIRGDPLDYFSTIVDKMFIEKILE